ncbi:hypothetical protein DL240_12655 [Lujinxingia litoralis]|uniref:Uncharacterized protein n=1 Tax=Lujinxingia litoralis TaxID=2211119 RepID=A0A328C7T7_9DELT|nr:hypothetical protein [Lujinxingia litoralis]RAL21698.1 hypothetical protein DL240_12655 [Lujinxingia litoralis]
MRQILCTFDSPREYFAQLKRHDEFSRHGDTLAFLGAFGLRQGEVIKVSIVVESCDQRTDLHMRIVHRRPSAAGRDRGAPWRYQAVVTAEDAIWLQMFSSKMATLLRVGHPSI